MARSRRKSQPGRQTITRRRLVVAASSFLAAGMAAACTGASTRGAGTSSVQGSVTASSPSGTYTPSDGTPQAGGRAAYSYSTSENFNPVSNWSEGTFLGGLNVYDRPLTSRED